MEIFDPEEQQGKIFDPEVGFIDPYDRDALSTLKRVGKKVYYSGKSMIQGMGLTKDILDIEAGYTPQPPEAAEVPFMGIKDTYIEDKTPKLEKIKEAAKPITETKKVLEGLEKETPPERRGEVISKPSLLKQPWWYLESIVPSAVGSAGGFAGLNAFTSFFSSLMPSLPGRVVAAGSAAMMETYANMADQYISANEAFLKKGKTPEEAHKLAWKEAQKVGKYEIILDTAFNLVGNKLPKTELTKLKQFISSVKGMFKSEIPQEVGQQLIQNKASMEGHDPGRKWYEGVPESAIGALVGTPFGGFLKYLLGRMKKRGGSTVDTSVLDESVLEEESKPKALPPAVFPMPPSSIYDPEVSEVVSEVTQEEQNLEQFKQIFDPEEVPLVKDYEIVVSGQVQGIGTEPQSFDDLVKYSEKAVTNFATNVQGLIGNYFSGMEIADFVPQLYIGEESGGSYEPSIKFSLNTDINTAKGIASFLGSAMKQNSVIVADYKSDNPNGTYIEFSVDPDIHESVIKEGISKNGITDINFQKNKDGTYKVKQFLFGGSEENLETFHRLEGLFDDIGVGEIKLIGSESSLIEKEEYENQIKQSFGKKGGKLYEDSLQEQRRYVENIPKRSTRSSELALGQERKVDETREGIGSDTEPIPETARGYEESQTEEAGKSQVGKKKSTPKPWSKPFSDKKNLKDLRTQKYFQKLNIFKKHLKNPKLWAWLGTKKGDKKAYSPDAPRDEKGYPLVLFHGTAAMGIGGKAVDFPSFDTLKIRSFGTHFGNLSQAHFFVRNHPFGRILPTILNIKNPLRMQDLSNWYPQRILDELNRLHIILDNETLSAYDNAVQETERMNILWNGLAKKGYDGIVYINRYEGFSKKPLFEDVSTLNDEDFKTKYPQAKDSYIIFDPTQAKSIFNQGIFGKDNPDMLYCGFPFSSFLEWMWKKDALKEAKTFFENINSGKISFVAAPNEVKWFKNRVKKIFTFPATVAEKFPKFRKYFDTARDMLTLQDMLSWDFFDKLTPYLLLENKDNIHKVLEYARLSKGQFNPTDQILQKAGLSQEEIDAYRSVESAMDFGWRLLKASFMEKAKYIKDPVEKKAYINKINGLIDARKRENYVPFSRFGDFYVLVKDSNGKIINYSYYESKNDMKKVANDFVKKGYTVETGEVLKKAEEYRNVRNRSILDALADVDNDMLELGFTKHLLRSEDVPGYSSDLKRSILDYILSVSRFVARRKAAYEFDSYTDSIDPKKESGLYNYANRYAQYVLSNDSEAVKFREFMFYYYLGFNAKSALVNLTQTLTTTVPVLSKYFKVPEAHIPLYIKQASEYLLNPDRFARKNHELYQAITFGVKHGKIAENMARFLRGEEQGTNEKITTFKEMAAWMFDKAEVFNRTVALIAGYDVGKRQGMTPNEALVFAERFVDETQFDYSKVNRPEIARSWRAPLFTFRMFLGNYLSLLKKSMQEKEWEVLARMLGYMTALGGLFAIPGIKELDKILTTLGVDTKLTLRKTFGKFSEVVLHGLPTLFGANISGTIGVGELAPEIEEGLAPAIGRAIGGVALDLPTRVGRALWLYRDKDSPYRAIEALMPEAVRNPMVAARWASEGVRPPSLENVIPKENITGSDIALKSLGLSPSRVTKAYELENTEKFMVDKIRKRNAKANWSVAKALYEDMQNNTNTVQDILDKIDEHNNKAEKIEDFIRLDPTAIKDYVTLMISPQSVEIKKMPKVGRPGYLERQELYQ